MMGMEKDEEWGGEGSAEGGVAGRGAGRMKTLAPSSMLCPPRTKSWLWAWLGGYQFVQLMFINHAHTHVNF